MRVSQRLDYSLRVLVLLAQQPPEASVAAGDLADRLNLPRRFVEQQVSALSRAGIVACRRGAHGGCALARTPADISVAEIVTALEGEIIDVPHTTGSAAAEMWQRLAREIEGLLAQTSLEELCVRQSEIDGSHSGLYYI